jgi:hypothetical protein
VTLWPRAFVVFFFGVTFCMVVFLALAAGDFPLALLGLLLLLLAARQSLPNSLTAGPDLPLRRHNWLSDQKSVIAKK